MIDNQCSFRVDFKSSFKKIKENCSKTRLMYHYEKNDFPLSRLILLEINHGKFIAKILIKLVHS